MARVRRWQRGSAAIQLLVVMACVGVAIAIGVRGIVNARATARKLRCAQQMRDLTMCCITYDTDRRSFPGYRNVLLMTDNTSYSNPTTGDGGVSWLVPLLPYLDDQEMYDKFRSTENRGVVEKMQLENLVCPAKFSAQAAPKPWLGYVVNAGCIDDPGKPRAANRMGMPRDWGANGVFFDRFTGNPTANMRKGQPPNAGQLVPMVAQNNTWVSQRDGTAFTLLMSENLDHGLFTDVYEAALGMIWDIEVKVRQNPDPAEDAVPWLAKPSKKSYRINSHREPKTVRAKGTPAKEDASYDFSRPSSVHAGGVNVAYCDGHVGFLSDKLDYVVYCLLMTPDGKNVRIPGTTDKFDESWCGTQIAEAWLKN